MRENPELYYLGQQPRKVCIQGKKTRSLFAGAPSNGTRHTRHGFLMFHEFPLSQSIDHCHGAVLGLCCGESPVFQSGSQDLPNFYTMTVKICGNMQENQKIAIVSATYCHPIVKSDPFSDMKMNKHNKDFRNSSRKGLVWFGELRLQQNLSFYCSSSCFIDSGTYHSMVTLPR